MSNVHTNGDLQEFDDIYPELVHKLLGEMNPELNDVANYMKRMSDHVVPHGKKNRGLMVAAAYRSLTSPSCQSVENIKLAHIAGWCIEWMQASFLVHDDIMDGSKTRRGKPCWYIQSQNEGLGLMAVNDGIHLGAALYILLKEYFKNKDYYIDLVTLYQDTLHQTCMGQCLDMITSPTQVDLNRFTLDRYKAIVKWKTAYYSFYLPIAAAMIMAGVKDKRAFQCAEMILLEMGEYFQVQDDFLDCYGDPAVTGKVGTDVEEAKCSWLVVQALDRVTPEQRKILEDNYGKPDPDCAAKVKLLYNQLNMRAIYQGYEEDSFRKVMAMIKDIDSNLLPNEMFSTFAQRIYKRVK